VLGATPAAVVPLVAYVVVLLAAPTAILALYSFFEAGFFSVEETLSLESWRELFSSNLYWTLLGKSLAIGLATATIVVVLGFVLAYAMTFRLGRFGTWLLVFMTATLLASYVVRIFAWKTILGTEGILNEALLRLGLVDEPLGFLLFGYFAIVFTLVYVYLPIAALPVYAGLQDIDPRVLEASRDLGAVPSRVFWTVTMPLAAPALRVGFAFAFVLATSDYVAPGLVGGLHGQMIGRTIADQFGGSSNYPLGAALSLTLLLSFAVVLALLWLAGRAAQPVLTRLLIRRGAPPATEPSALSRALHRVPWSILATIVLVAYLTAPIAVVVLFSFTESRIPGLPLTGLTLDWYTDVLSSAAFHRVVRTSVVVAAIGVAGALLIGVPAASALARRRFGLRRVVEGAVYAPLVIPGVAVGIALLTACVYLGVRLGWPVAASVHVLLLLPYVVLVVRARVATMNPQVEEAARDLGAGRLRAWRTVTLPQIAPALVAAAVLAAAVSLDELIVTNLVIGGDATIPTWLLGQMRLGLTPAINAVAVLLLVVPMLVLLLGAALLRLRGGSRLVRSLTGSR
jgi:ABC-type spermidine/putrescine transport system permease subunit II